MRLIWQTAQSWISWESYELAWKHLLDFSHRLRNTTRCAYYNPQHGRRNRRHHLFGVPPPVTQASNAAVTFNSRAQRRPICVVRTSITPDKARVIYLPSTRDAITRPLLTFPSFAPAGKKKQEEEMRNKKKHTNDSSSGHFLNYQQ